ncbi:retrovirus-related pol polyprotein from transposon TNT 1-94 [Tanacetum coccineum]
MSINHEKYTLVIIDEYLRNFSAPYTPKQNGVAERKKKTLIEAARIMLNGSVLSKHSWTKAVKISCYTQNRSIIVKRHDKTPYEIFRERIPHISYYHVFGCPMFIHNHKDHLGKFDVKADDGYFLGYYFVSKAFKVFNIRRQQVEETYHVTFDESMEAIRFTNTSKDEIGIDDSSRYPPDDFIHEDDPSRQYQIDFDISYYVIPHVPDVPQSHVSNQASNRSHHVPHDRWSKDQHIELVNIIGDPGEGMLTRSMAAKLIAASASECLFAKFLSEIKPKKEEGIDYDETFAPVARMEAIRIFLAFATYMNFKVYQMDVKSAFLNDDIIFGSTSYKLCKQFKKLMTKKFEMSIMGELTYFLRLQIKQDGKGISICQEQYTRNFLKKYKISDSSSMKTPMVPPNNLGPDLAGKPVNETSYRGMIGSLMYLTATRLDIQFSTVLCARYQSNPKESHLTTMKRILRYMKGTLTLGLYYPKCSGFYLKGYSDSNYAGCNIDRKSTSGACQILGGKLVYWSAKKQQSVAMSSAEAEYVVAAGCCAIIMEYFVKISKKACILELKQRNMKNTILTSNMPANLADIFAFVIDRLNHKKLIKEAMTGVMTKLILRECMEKAQAESGLAKPKIDNNVKIELSKENLKELRTNAYSGIKEEDVVDQIAKVLKIRNLIKTPNMDTDRLRVYVFSFSLTGVAREW